MIKLIDEYYHLMQSIDPTFHWHDRLWWQDESRARVILAAGDQGFAIIGYGANVDDDVASEICELYCKNPWALRSLIQRCLPHIRWPFGFQVLQANLHAQRSFEGFLDMLGIPYTRIIARDGASQVVKYRVQRSHTLQCDDPPTTIES